MTIGYQFKSATNQIWVILLTLACLITYYATMHYNEQKANVIAVDLAIAKEVLDKSSEHCIKIKAKNFMARADGGQVQGGCAR